MSTRSSTPHRVVRRIRVVILNWNGGPRLAEAVASVLDAGWSGGDLEVVVVDNASTDGSLEQVVVRFGDAVRVVRNRTNTGFGANNLALRDLAGVDAVALVNPDASVEPGWLEPLAATLDADAGLGAACPLLVFGPRFARVTVQAPTFVPGGGDERELGVRLEGVRSPGVDGADPLGGVVAGDGVHDLEHGRSGPYRWLAGTAELLVPLGRSSSADPASPSAHEVQVDGTSQVDGGSQVGGEAPTSGPAGATVELRLGADVPTRVRLVEGGQVREEEVGPRSRWVSLAVTGPGVDVVQNAGSLVYADGAGADRGWGRERGLLTDVAADVFAWCGGAVLLRSAYLDDVGLFHEPFFLYYEDTDLSWRGQARGWRYRYVPDAVVRHDHAGSSGTSSARFAHFNERNRLLVLFRNAPGPLVRREVAGHLRETLAMGVRDTFGPLRRGARPRPVVAWRRLKAFASFLAVVPREVGERRRLRGAQTVPDSSLLARLTPR